METNNNNNTERTYKALPGYSMTLAIYEGGRYIGFVPVSDLGFETVGDWKRAQFNAAKKVA